MTDTNTNLPTAAKLNSNAKRFAQDTAKNGARGLNLVLERISAALANGDIQPCFYMADALAGSDGATVQAIFTWVFGDALKCRISKKTGDRTITFKQVDRDANEEKIGDRLRALRALTGQSFRGVAVAALIARPKGKTAEFDRAAFITFVLKRLNDNEESVALFATDLAKAAVAAKAMGA